MRPQERLTARRQLDKRLNSLQNMESLVRPPKGWVKAIREALGMTTSQLARRLGVAQSRAVTIEQAEAKGAITLGTLEKAAQALDCRLVYVLVPRKPLETLVEDRAQALAKQRLKSTAHSMALEDQSVDAADESEQLKALTKRLIEEAGSKLWDEQ
ncbi:MAG: mobile mystery protein A [Candidatus Thiodiazotropha sp. (ex Troendleina suluensis)]|nr:mobile mystery protein A [Candidatus Thiodiazotropha sp. (ex Troendleina suluensis)]